MPDTSFDELLNGYINNQLTRKELSSFLQLLQKEEHAARFKDYIEELFEDDSLSELADHNRADIIFQKTMDAAAKEDNIPGNGVVLLKPKSTFFTFSRIAAAAAVVGLILFGTYSIISKRDDKKLAATETKNNSYKNEVLPGGDKAILTLADGSTIVLDTMQNGNLAQQGNTTVIKLDGKLAYNAANAGANDIAYNTLTTPRGGQYQVELPDGTRVWLNAASSLRFPTAFVGGERRVEISGEAYFEVAKNKAMPFVVSVNGTEVHVLGTHFNVMAYSEEGKIATTLLEGSVQVSKAGKKHVIVPGQQAVWKENGDFNLNGDIDLEEVVSWKNGKFHFNNADIKVIMRQIARWYDVDVEYRDNLSETQLGGIVSRKEDLRQLLSYFEMTGKVKFNLEGRKIIVTR